RREDDARLAASQIEIDGLDAVAGDEADDVALFQPQPVGEICADPAGPVIHLRIGITAVGGGIEQGDPAWRHGGAPTGPVADPVHGQILVLNWCGHTLLHRCTASAVRLVILQLQPGRRKPSASCRAAASPAGSGTLARASSISSTPRPGRWAFSLR